MAVIATGFFDGVHLGHRQVLDTLVSCAREMGQEAIVITFSRHPRMVLGQDADSLRLLNSPEEKRALLMAAGVDRVEYVDFTPQFAAMTTMEYLQFLKSRYGAGAVVIGYDNRMGRDAGTADDIEARAKAIGLEVIRTDGIAAEGVTVSSTKIREALTEGNVTLASEMLGYSYQLHGVVVEGNRLGRTIGFPTANMQLYEPLKLIPANGVYLAKVEALGRTYCGMTNVGTRPTVTGVSATDANSDRLRTIETNIFGFGEDIYGLDIHVTFLARIREEKHFSSMDELRAQLELDRDACMALSGRF